MAKINSILLGNSNFPSLSFATNQKTKESITPKYNKNTLAELKFTEAEGTKKKGSKKIVKNKITKDNFSKSNAFFSALFIELNIFFIIIYKLKFLINF